VDREASTVLAAGAAFGDGEIERIEGDDRFGHGSSRARVWQGTAGAVAGVG